MQEVLSEYLLTLLGKIYTPEDLEKILSGFACRRTVSLRVNTLKSDLRSVCSALKAVGIAFETVPWSDTALILPDTTEKVLWDLPLYQEGHIYLQNLSSMLPPIVLSPKKNENILDMAAAPGGKTTQIAAMTDGQAMITACERNSGRAEKLRFNLSRQGAGRVTVMNMDASQLDDAFRFDRILLDAPCSGSGTCCSLPGSRNGQFNKVNLDKTCKAQTALLKKALTLLKPGNEMVYSTCSILPMENEEIVSKCMGGKAEIVPIDPARFEGLPLLPNTLPGTLTVAPSALYEGFYVAKLRKKK